MHAFCSTNNKLKGGRVTFLFVNKTKTEAISNNVRNDHIQKMTDMPC